jgi:hypothetical protein
VQHEPAADLKPERAPLPHPTQRDDFPARQRIDRRHGGAQHEERLDPEFLQRPSHHPALQRL